MTSGNANLARFTETRRFAVVSEEMAVINNKERFQRLRELRAAHEDSEWVNKNSREVWE